MLEILHFIFSSFWIWIGTVILITATFSAIGSAIANIVSSLRE